MSRQKTITLYQFDELSDAAKEKARQWMRQCRADDTFDAECVLDDAKEALKVLGFSSIDIAYSGFSSQGDGASFTGNFYASDGTNGVQKLLVDRPTDKELARIASELERILLACPELSASFTRHGRYCHEMSVSIDIDLGDEESPSGATSHEESFKEVSRDLMRWIYKALESDHDYRNADEQIDDDIRANEYEFTEDGERA